MENTEKQTPVQPAPQRRKPLTRYQKFEKSMGMAAMIVYRLRKLVMAAPVVFYALKFASYNSQHLPELVGLDLQSSGEFAIQISRQLAVLGPLAITGACLIMMFLSRKAMYSWAISAFTLVLPLLLLLSNQYPA